MKRTVHTAVGLVLLIACACLALTGCPPADPLYSFAVIADPHACSDGVNRERLADCVEWVNANAEANTIELVFVVGDIAWGGVDRIEGTKAILDGLEVPYLPLIGDNELHGGDEENFGIVFGPHYDQVGGILENWNRAPTPSWNPETEEMSWFHNFSFDHRGVHFMGLDWCTRFLEGIAGEQADLHDFAGGTWPWFTQDIEACDKEIANNIVMLTHHPMHVAPIVPVEAGAFSVAELDVIESFTSLYGDNVYANLAGHYHIWWHEIRRPGQYEIFITKATHLAENTLRLVTVLSDGTAFSYQHTPVVVPASAE